MKKNILKWIEKAGYKLTKNESPEKTFPDFDREFWALYHKCKPHTMTSPERLYALYQAVNYVCQNNIPGDFVECGVWKGGSSMMIAETLKLNNITDRKIFLYDTFEGMSEPTENDKDYRGQSADGLLQRDSKEVQDSVWCYSPLEEVKTNMKSTNYPDAQIVFVKGKVEETIPKTIPSIIALLRLDTDWYESTKHELIHLFPLLKQQGVIIIDDYGYWEGCRKAVDEYFNQNKIQILLSRIDYTGRMGIK